MLRKHLFDQIDPELRASGELDFYREWMIAAVGAGDIKLPLLPRTATEVLRIANDPNADLQDLAQLIECDQSLAGNVLRVANSAAFGASRFNSLQDAIARLGMQNLVEITLSLSLKAGIFRNADYHDELSLTWKHALAASAFGKEIALLCRSNPEVQYLCGLLHTVGKPIALNLLISMQRERIWPMGRREILYLIEDTHMALGSRVAMDWNLPPQVATVCGFYSNYSNAPAFARECAMTFLSSLLATWLIENSDDMEENQKAAKEILDNPVVGALGLSAQHAEGLLSKAEIIAEKVKSLSI